MNEELRKRKKRKKKKRLRNQRTDCTIGKLMERERDPLKLASLRALRHFEDGR